MPANRNAQLRYQVIDRCLRNRGRYWTWEDIIEQINIAIKEDNPKSKGIGKTTFYEDLKDIEYRVYNGEIERIKLRDKKRTVCLRYNDPNYSINNQPLNETEISQLKSAIKVLTRFKGMPQFEWIVDIIPAIESKLGLISLENEVLSFEANDDYEGLKFIATIFNAIVYKRVLKILYKDFRSTLPYEFVFHPYYLKQYKTRWFVLGHNPEKSYEIQNLALDRIKQITETSIKYIKTNIDWNDYFYDIIGVTKNKRKPIEIKLLITDPEQAAYISTKPLHPSQKKVKKVKKGYETRITVIPNYELENMILSYGERIMVLSPKIFKEKIKDRILKMNDLYKD